MIKEILEHEFRECYDVMIKTYTAADEKRLAAGGPVRGRENKYEDIYSEWKAGHMLFGCHPDGKIIGMIRMIHSNYNSCIVKDLAILPEYQQKGYGREFIEFAKVKSKELGANKMDLGFFLDNEPLKRWYEKQGLTLSRISIHTYDGIQHEIGIIECDV